MNIFSRTTATTCPNSIVGNTQHQHAMKAIVCALAISATLGLSACGKAPRVATTAERTRAITESEISSSEAKASAPNGATSTTPSVATANLESTK